MVPGVPLILTLLPTVKFAISAVLPMTTFPAVILPNNVLLTVKFPEAPASPTVSLVATGASVTVPVPALMVLLPIEMVAPSRVRFPLLVVVMLLLMVSALVPVPAESAISVVPEAPVVVLPVRVNVWW